MNRLTRRRLLGTGVVLAGAAVTRPAGAGAPRTTPVSPALAPATRQTWSPPAIHPRRDWTAQSPGPLPVEAPGDVRFLLVHHTASANEYAAEDVPALLRGILAQHTGAQRGWPDIAYNFLVDRHGGVWEGRAGSVDAPVQPDATGGSQGYAQLCCWIGDHEAQPPTPAAVDAMAGLLAWLATRYVIDPLGVTTFTSRGSNRHPAGSVVTTPTIAGHRDMSQTVCPGRHGYALVRQLPTAVAAVMAAAPISRGGDPTTPLTPAPDVTTPATAQPAVTPETEARAGTPLPAPATTTTPTARPSARPAAGPPDGTTGGGGSPAEGVGPWPSLGAGAIAALLGGAFWGMRGRGRPRADPAPSSTGWATWTPQPRDEQDLPGRS